MQQDLPDRDTLSNRNLDLATTLNERKRSLVYFYSSKCVLCNSLTHLIEREKERCKDWLNISSICTDHQAKWAPEMINYQIETVPCFVLLNQEGNAIAKSGKPRGKSQVTSALQTLLRLAQPAPRQQQ